MKPKTQDRLLKLNRRFYEQVAHDFDATRQGWTPGLWAILPYFRAAGKERLSVLDVGCGNGRFARLLEEAGVAASYTGVDGNGSLLRLARQSTANLARVECQFFQADFANRDWASVLTGNSRAVSGHDQATTGTTELPKYTVVLCTATMQHMPSYALRLRLMRDLQRLREELVVVSFWQFFSSDRFRKKLIDPGTVGVSDTELEPGDALLPWRQGVESVRYVHQVDEAELRRLAAGAGLSVLHTFRADGKEADLNLYAILGRADEDTALGQGGLNKAGETAS